MRSIRAFLRLSRLHFLVGGALLFAVGAGTAEAIDVRRYLIAQAMVTATQLTAHYVNEYSDFEADRLVQNRTWFSGGSGVLVEGALTRAVALRAAAGTTIVAVVACLGVATFSLTAAATGILAVGVSWAYSWPPMRLADSGLGEAAVSLIVAGAVPLVGLLAQQGTTPAALWWAIAVLVPIHFAMMLSFEIPDLASDDAAGKRVLAVRLGRKTTTRLMGAALVAAAGASLLGGATHSLPSVAVWASLTGIMPAAVMMFAAARRNYAALTSAAVATLVFVATGLLVGVSV